MQDWRMATKETDMAKVIPGRVLAHEGRLYLLKPSARESECGICSGSHGGSICHKILYKILRHSIVIRCAPAMHIA